MLAYLPQTGIITIDGFHFNNEIGGYHVTICYDKKLSKSSKHPVHFLKMQNWHCPLKEENFRKRKNSRSSQQLKATHRLKSCVSLKMEQDRKLS